MSNFQGGSAYAMAQQVADGYVIVTERTFKRLAVPELQQLDFELDRLMRTIRGDQPAIDDLPAVKQRNRRLQRLTSCRMMLQTYRKSRRR